MTAISFFKLERELYLFVCPAYITFVNNCAVHWYIHAQQKRQGPLLQLQDDCTSFIVYQRNPRASWFLKTNKLIY